MNKKMMKGFTLVEIMIVVAIIAILAAIAIPNFVKYRSESQNNACVSTQASIITAAENWLSKPGRGSKAPELSDLVTTGNTPGYFKTEPKCPTGGAYEIELGANKEVTVKCTAGHKAEEDSSSSSGSGDQG